LKVEVGRRSKGEPHIGRAKKKQSRKKWGGGVRKSRRENQKKRKILGQGEKGGWGFRPGEFESRKGNLRS